MVVQEVSEDRVGTNDKEEERVNGEGAEKGDEEEKEEEEASDSPEEGDETSKFDTSNFHDKYSLEVVRTDWQFEADRLLFLYGN